MYKYNLKSTYADVHANRIEYIAKHGEPHDRFTYENLMNNVYLGYWSLIEKEIAKTFKLNNWDNFTIDHIDFFFTSGFIAHYDKKFQEYLEHSIGLLPYEKPLENNYSWSCFEDESTLRFSYTTTIKEIVNLVTAELTRVTS